MHIGMYMCLDPERVVLRKPSNHQKRHGCRSIEHFAVSLVPEEAALVLAYLSYVLQLSHHPSPNPNVISDFRLTALFLSESEFISD
jgi:hypothetical protein